MSDEPRTSGITPEHSAPTPWTAPRPSTRRVESDAAGALEAAGVPPREAGPVLRAVDDLARVEPGELSGTAMTDLLTDLETIQRRLFGLRTRLLSAIEADGRWALDGSRSFSAWLRRTTNSSAGEAWRSTTTARALREHLPATAEALASGRITNEHARLMATHTTSTPERIAALAHPSVGEAFLIEQATRYDASDFARLLGGWAIAADPAGADAEYAHDTDRQELVVAKVLHGYHIQGWLTEADGATLAAALDAVIGVPDRSDQRSPAGRRAAALIALARLGLDSGTLAPSAAIRPHLSVHVPHQTLLALVAAQTPSTTDAPGPHPNLSPPPGSRKSPESPESPGSPASPGALGGGPPGAPGATSPDVRDAKARDLSTATAPQSPEPAAPPAEPFTGAGQFAWPAARPPEPPAPTRSDAAPLIIPGGLDHHALLGVTPAELDGGTPIPPALLARLACDSELARVVFGATGEVLDVGRTQRLFPPGQRRGIIARDRRCRFPGCDAPPAAGEIHHSIWWYAQHGQTRIQDGVLLCWAHHDHVHANRITITRHPATPPAPQPTWVFTRPNGTQITALGPKTKTRPTIRSGAHADAQPRVDAAAHPVAEATPGTESAAEPVAGVGTGTETARSARARDPQADDRRH